MATQEEWDDAKFGIGIPREQGFLEALGVNPGTMVGGTTRITFEGGVGMVYWTGCLVAPASVVAEAIAASVKE